ncbi:DUF4145 domain-containing protein [Corticimicrobacter populi]|nr:DUF4145 domain-containing protein [Corticimicrobacter populi]
MTWEKLYRHIYDPTGGPDDYEHEALWQCICYSCRGITLWQGFNVSGKMLSPQTTSAPMPHANLPDACSRDYSEARSIAQASPRGAAALLRLCIQKLCVELGQPGKNINSDIAALVKEGLPTRVQQALDIVRVVGNEAVHPGVMTEEDHADQVHTLFELVNIIVEQMISQPQRLENMFASLPEGSREAIAKRDSKK